MTEIPPIYRMSAHENTAADYISSPYVNQTACQSSPGSTFDFVRRLILYNARAYPNGTPTNDTGYNLWSGQNLIAPGATYNAGKQKNLRICTKDIDSEEVTWNDCYNVSRTVPAGIQLKIAGTKVAGSGYVDGTYLGVPLTGGSGTGAFANITVIGGVVSYVDYIYNAAGGYAVSDVLTASNTYLGGSGSGFTFTITSIARTANGSERRFVESQGDCFPQLVDPRTGNTWVHVDSTGGTYICSVYLFRSDDSFQQVISPLLPAHPNSHMEPIGISDAWAYVVEDNASETSHYHLCLTPRELTVRETGADFLLTYASYDFPALFNAMSSGPNAFVFTDDQTTYFLYMGLSASTSSVSRGYKLYRFDEPTSATGSGSVVGGGFTDVTPWAAGTGPNTNAASYTYNKSTGQSGWNQPTNNFLYHLRDTNQIGILSKFFSWQTSNTLTVDPALTFFDFTYFDIDAGTFDYHHAFVTGYMDADWNPLPSGTGAAWIVIDATQVNQFVGQNTYSFADHDYTKVWFSFVVQPYDAGFAGPDRTLWHTILVEYTLAYGSAPTVSTIYDETNWDTKYAAYGTEIDNTNVVWQSQGIVNQDAITNSGIYDATGNAFWWGGDSNLLSLNFSLFDVPFLKLSFTRADHPNILLWTYEMDGHEYLVVPLQEETLVYDFLVEQWYVWGNDETPVWAAQHGQNWNANLGTVLDTLGGERVSNVICGDRETGALYFLDPELNEDYSNTGVSGQPFQRVITGQLLSRSRDYTPLPAVEVTASDGEAVTASNMTVDLQYSDDRGHTYYSFGTRTVATDEMGIQCQWRSLGSYRTPGRLLKLIDYGALTRVDDWTVPDDG